MQLSSTGLCCGRAPALCWAHYLHACTLDPVSRRVVAHPGASIVCPANATPHESALFRWFTPFWRLHISRITAGQTAKNRAHPSAKEGKHTRPAFFAIRPRPCRGPTPRQDGTATPAGSGTDPASGGCPWQVAAGQTVFMPRLHANSAPYYQMARWMRALLLQDMLVTLASSGSTAIESSRHLDPLLLSRR